MKLNQTMKRIVCLALSLMMVFGVVTPAFASTSETEEKNKVVAEIVASIDLTNKKAEEAVKIHLAQSTTPAVATTEQLLAETNGSIEEILPVIDQVVAYANDKLTTGCANSEEALFFYNNVATLQESCQKVNEAAKANLATAQANLAAAQAAYDEAVALSLASKEVIKAELEIAKAAVSEAEAVLEITTNKLLSVENVLAEAAADVNAWKAEAQNALDAAAGHLAESNAQLDATLEALAIENAEFVAAVETFKTQSEVFATSVRTLADSIEDAKTKDAALNALYAEYAAVKAAYEASLADFSAVAGTEVLSYEEANQVKADLHKAWEDAEKALADVDARYNEVKAEREALDGYFYQIAVMDEYENEQGKNTVIRNLVGHVIQTKLASGLEVVWNDGTYGKSDNGFYVVLDGERVRRYGYQTTEAGEVKICKMQGAGRVDYVLYTEENAEKEDKYALTEKVTETGKKSYITTNAGKELEVREVVENNKSVYKVVIPTEKTVYKEYDAHEVDLTEKTPKAIGFKLPGFLSTLADFLKLGNTIELANLDKNNSVTFDAVIPVVGRQNYKFVAVKTEAGEWKVERYDANYDDCTVKHTKKSWGKVVDTDCAGVKNAGCETTYKASGTYLDDVTVTYYKGLELAEKLNPEDITVEDEDRVWYPLVEEKYITVGNKQIEITIETESNLNDSLEDVLGGGEVIETKTTYRHYYNVPDERLENATYSQGGDKDTTFVEGEVVSVAFNGKDYANVFAYCDAVYTEFARLEVALKEATDARDAAKAKSEAANKAFEAVKAKYDEFSAKDLGVLAALPKNIEEFVNLSNIESLEDITALVDAIAVINNEDAGVEEKINAYAVVASYIPGLGAIIPDLTSWEFWQSVITGKFNETEIGKLLTPGTFQHEYFMAWIDAFVSKVKVVEAAIEVVDEARKTITAGLEIIYTGAELSDVAIQAMIEKIENETLSGAVAALTLTVDMVEVSDEMVNAVYAQVAALRNEVAKAEAELEAATAKLTEIEYQNPGQAELNAAKAGLDAANANYNAVAGKLANVEAYITQAETYKTVAWAQYEELLAFEVPAAGEVDPETGVEVPSEGEVVLPTPGVEYVSYTVVFMSEGVELSVQTVEAGTAAVAPTAPTKAADENYTYTFAGWDVDFTNVTSDLVVTAQFTAEGILPEEGEGPVELPTPSVTHTVTYIVDGEEIVVEVPEGEEPSAPEVPKEIVVDGVAYRFVRWAERYVEETGATVLEPVYEEVVKATVQPSAPVVEETPVIYGYYAAPVVEVEAEVEEVVENVVTDNEITIEDEVVEIEDEETPLADGVTDIVEEEVPLAANKEEEPAVAPVAAVAGTATFAVAGFVAFLFFRRKKSL